LSGFPNTVNERTYGMYERKGIDKDIEKYRQQKVELVEEIKKADPNNKRHLKRLNHKLERANDKCRTATETREKIITWKD